MSARPSILPPNLDGIPAELRERSQWLVWRLEKHDGRWTKVPYQARRPDRRASSTKPGAWAKFEEAWAAREKADGIGYVFAADDPFVGLDLDDLPEADKGAIMLVLDSYAERSVTKADGYHVFVRASLNGHGRHPASFGVFGEGRYFTVTGAHVVGTPTTIEERQAELGVVLDQFLPEHEERPAARPVQPVDADDGELLERARRARNGAAFDRLHRGDWSGYPSQSEADLALCSKLAFWTGRDPERIDRLFRSSGLYREKWEREDYREKTIEEAIAGCSETYASRVTRGFESPESAALVRGSSGLGDSVTPTLEESPSPESLPRGAEGDSDPESPRRFALPLREFIGRPRERREPILADVDGRAVIGHRSLTLCGGLGGTGKTTLSLDLFLHLAAGIDYPPFTVPAPVSILMIENEGPEDLFAEKLEARLATFPHELKGRLDVCVFDWGGFNLAEEAHRERLASEIIDKGYDLVFGDPLDSLGIDGVGSPQDTRNFLLLMKLAGLNKTCAWWLNTHPRKEETREALNEIAGAWGGKPDSVLLLRMLADDRTQVRFPKLRWAKRGKRPAILLGFDPETEAYTYLGEESEEERDYLAEIRALLADERWRTAREIAATSGAGGIGANVDRVKAELAQHPELFESRTGAEAQAVGRSPSATVWALRQVEDDLRDHFSPCPDCGSFYCVVPGNDRCLMRQEEAADS